MGDRGNVRLEYAGKHQPIYLYTHWHGTDLPTIVADALNSKQGRNRWDDPDYLARIIFTNMVKSEKNDDGETGFGIAPYRMDHNHPDIIVDLYEKTVDGMSYERYIELWATRTVDA